MYAYLIPMLTYTSHKEDTTIEALHLSNSNHLWNIFEIFFIKSTNEQKREKK